MASEIVIRQSADLPALLSPLRRKQQLLLMWMLLLGTKDGTKRAGIAVSTLGHWRRNDPAFLYAYDTALAERELYAQDAFVMLAQTQGIIAVEQFAWLNELSWTDCYEDYKGLVGAKLKVGEFFANRVLPLVQKTESFSFEKIIHQIQTGDE